MAPREPVAAETRAAVEHAARLSAPDRALAAKLAPPPARDDLVTLAAYLGEAARVARSATEPTLGLTRLAWWRGAIEQGYEGAQSGNPISIDGQGEMNLDRQINLTLHATAGRGGWNVPGISAIIGEASQQIMQIRVDGTVEIGRSPDCTRHSPIA